MVSSNLKKRILMGAILIPLVVAITIYGGYAFMALMIAAWFIMLAEWFGLMKLMPKHVKFWHAFGFIYITAACASMVALREVEGSGLNLTIWLFLVIWGTDIGAYIAGKSIGGAKIAPSISPNKTWAGLMGGIMLAVASSSIFLGITDASAPIVHALLAAGFAIAAQIGDFFESWIKRKCDVKDSSNLIPGHGGLLDRVDGLLLVAPLAYGSFYFTMLAK